MDLIVSIVLLSLGAITSSVFIYSKVTNYSLKTIVFKTIASAFFVALGIYLFIASQGHFLFKLFLLLGLIFGLLGDVFLGFKYITTKTKKMWILLGLFAFAFGHISYIVSLFVEYYISGNVLFAVLPFVTAIVLTILYMFIFKKVGVEFGKMLPFGAFYILCLSTMVSVAFYMAILNGFNNITLVMFFIGAFFFACSDTMLAGAYFKKGQRSKTYNAVYSVFYYLAQFLIAFALYFLIK